MLSLNRYNQQFIKWLKSFFIFFIAFSLAKVVFVLRFGGLDLFLSHTRDIIKAIYVGFKFDTQIILYASIPVVVLNLFTIIISSEAIQRTINTFSRYYLIMLFSLLMLVTLGDHQFYAFFQSHLNILVFGIAEDDTSAVLTSVWTDHPVLKLIFIWLLVCFVANYYFKKIYKSEVTLSKSNNSLLVQVIGLLLGLASIVIGLRGSVDTFPLQIKDASVSDNHFVNTIAPNGIFTFIKAAGERDNVRAKVDPKEIFSKYGFKNLEEASTVYFGSDASRNEQNSFFTKTEKNEFLEKNPPNVVFVLMEGMSNHYLDLEDENLNLTGNLSKHLKEDFLFRNFLPGENGTIGSVEKLTLNVPFVPLSATPHRFKTFESSAAYPFKQAGYETHFLTGGYVGWRQLDEMLPKNYFDKVEGKSAILSKVKGAKENDTWGVYDQYLFDAIYQELEQGETQKPKFIFAQTTTNHTPYELPEDYKPFQLALSDSLRNIVMQNDEMTIKCFEAYQYANHSLGLLLDQIKNSPFGDNTIVVATGDHNIRNLINYDKINDALAKYSVPLYMYIPDAYKKNISSKPERFGSHKDIFPTIFNLALSDISYFNFGNNLFDEDKDESLFFGINSSFVAYPSRYDRNDLDHKIKAREALIEYYFNEKF